MDYGLRIGIGLVKMSEDVWLWRMLGWVVGQLREDVKLEGILAWGGCQDWEDVGYDFKLGGILFAVSVWGGSRIGNEWFVIRDYIYGKLGPGREFFSIILPFF